MNYQIVAILDSVLGRPGRKFSKGEHRYYCPFCHHHNPNFAVNVINGRWQCLVCQTRGRSLLGLLYKLHADRKDIDELRTILGDQSPVAVEEEVERPLTLPDNFVPLWEPSGHTARALAYLSSRGVTKIDLQYYRMGICTDGRYAGRIIIPSYGEDWRLNYYIARDYTGTAMSYLNPPVSRNVVALESSINWNYPITLVEGMFDAMAVRRNAIPLLGKTLSRRLQQKIIEKNVTEIYLALDDDALMATSQIAKSLMDRGIVVHRVELSGKDPAIIGSTKMWELISNAKKMKFADLMNLKLSLC